MRKTASILAFLLGLGFVVAWITMTRDDALHAGENISRGFDEINSHDTAAFNADMQEAEARHNEERNYGIAGALVLIAGFALWPYGSRLSVDTNAAVNPPIEENEKQCPFCAEYVKVAAIKCRFCGSDLAI